MAAGGGPSRPAQSDVVRPGLETVTVALYCILVLYIEMARPV